MRGEIDGLPGFDRGNPAAPSGQRRQWGAARRGGNHLQPLSFEFEHGARHVPEMGHQHDRVDPGGVQQRGGQSSIFVGIARGGFAPGDPDLEIRFERSAHHRSQAFGQAFDGAAGHQDRPMAGASQRRALTQANQGQGAGLRGGHFRAWGGFGAQDDDRPAGSGPLRGQRRIMVEAMQQPVADGGKREEQGQGQAGQGEATAGQQGDHQQADGGEEEGFEQGIQGTISFSVSLAGLPPRAPPGGCASRPRLFFIVMVLAVSPAWGGALEVPDRALVCGETHDIVYHLDQPDVRSVRLAVRWSDEAGRVVEEWARPVDRSGAGRIVFQLDGCLAVVPLNHLRVRVEAVGGREEGAEVSVLAIPASSPWWDYQIIIWQGQTRHGYEALRAIGVTAGKLIAKDRPLQLQEGEEGGLLASGLSWYEENIATDFFSAYHRFTPGRAVNWKYVEAQARHRLDPASLTPFYRDPSLADPVWRARIGDRLARVVASQRRFRPLFYDLADEAGLADLAAYWDFDFSPVALAQFRSWLRQSYGSLAGLNRGWGTHFARWDVVRPQTAAEAVRGSGKNFAAWVDFRAWMDLSFAEAVAEATAVLHAADPAARAALAGAQSPGWGGYDYTRLATAVDVMEIYDFGGNVELLRSLNPELIRLSTLADSGVSARQRLWRAVLQGNRGVILWDEAGGFVDGAGRLGPRAVEMAPIFRELRSGLGALMIAARPVPARIALHYSPASFRVDWILDQRQRGGHGLELAHQSDHPEDEFTRLRLSLASALTDRGLEYRALSSQQIEQGDLETSEIKVLVLPRSQALSDPEAAAILRFADHGGIVIAAGPFGGYDEHGRRRPSPALGTALQVWPLNEGLAAAGITPTFPVTDPHTGAAIPGLEIRSTRNGDVVLLSVLTTLEQTGPVRITFPETRWVVDLRRRHPLGWRHDVEVTLAPDQPVLLALSPRPFPALELSGPKQLTAGTTGHFILRRAAPAPDQTAFFHVEIHDPAGRLVPHYSVTLTSPSGEITLPLPLARNDRPGRWSLTATDRISGKTASASVQVLPPNLSKQ